MKTSCLRLKLVELNFLVSFNTDDQSKTDVTYTVNVTTSVTTSATIDRDSKVGEITNPISSTGATRPTSDRGATPSPQMMTTPRHST